MNFKQNFNQAVACLWSDLKFIFEKKISSSSAMYVTDTSYPILG